MEDWGGGRGVVFNELIGETEPKHMNRRTGHAGN
jgi:hypothetical protein